MRRSIVLMLFCMLSFTTMAQSPDTQRHRFYICEGVGYGVGSYYGLFIPFHGDKPLVSTASLSLSAGYSFSEKFSLGIVGGYYRTKSFEERTAAIWPYNDPASIDYKVSYQSIYKNKETYFLGLEARYLYASMCEKRYQLYGATSLGINIAKGNYGGKYYEYYPNRPTNVMATSFYSPQLISGGWNPDFNITAVGIRSTQRLFWCAELGFGYKGLINAGVGYKF